MRAKVDAGALSEAEAMIAGSLTPARMKYWPKAARSKKNRWRTPKATDGSNGGPNARDSSGAPHLSGQVGGRLNPEWVEWLMGWPIGWTALDAAATALFLSKRPRRGRGSKI